MKATNEKRIVLVVDDEADLRHFSSRVLELEGYLVLQAEDGVAAIKLLNENKIDLILLDLKMPGEDGWSVLKKIKSEPTTAHISVIVFTASANVERKNRAMELGAAGYLIKPLSAGDLRKAVAIALRKKGGK